MGLQRSRVNTVPGLIPLPPYTRGSYGMKSQKNKITNNEAGTETQISGKERSVREDKIKVMLLWLSHDMFICMYVYIFI
jgi:hypothetical protein